MKLRSLRIKGFKSFANETILNFDEQVIGIVGPNGSGKSNVVDAIRWVLGEQKNRELRLDQMQDVIFNGTKKKKAANVASVTLNFDNTKNILPTEYNTVSISRILYRSGESEYRLNDVQCRLKDIRSLFVDTGIGSDSYAIIALGMVDDILSDKENARRRMFEQAAGISKYKQRKKETQNKLKSTKADLDRIEDILFELEGNLKSLQRQAKRTQKYLDIKEKYKELSIQLAIHSIQELKSEYKHLDTESKDLLERYRKNEVEINRHDSEVEKVKKSNLDDELKLSSNQRVLNDLTSKQRDLEEKKNLYIQNIKFKNSSKSNLENSILSLDSNIKQFNLEIGRLQESLELEILKVTSYKVNYEAAKQDYDKSKLNYDNVKNSYDQSLRLRQEEEQALFNTEKELALSQNREESLQVDYRNIKLEIDKLQESLEQLDKSNTESTNRLSEINTLIRSHKEKEATRKEKLTAIDQHILDKNKLISEIQRKLDAKQNEYDLLKSMINNYEGFPDSIKFLSKNWRSDIPILSDILDVNEEYKRSIEKYLENFLNYYIVDSYSQAREAIDLLIESQKGKASFFVLEALSKVEKKFETPKGSVPAVLVVDIEAKYKKLVSNLLSNAYIIDDFIDEFYTFDLNPDIVLLSKKGTHIKTRSSLSGGSVGLFDGNKIGRRKTLEKLEKTIKNLHKELDTRKSELDRLKQDKKKIENTLVQSDFNELTSVKQKLDQEIVRISATKDSISSQLDNLQKKFDHTENELNNVRSLIKKQGTQFETLKTQLSNSKVIVTDEELSKLAQSLSKNSEILNENNILLIRQQNHIENITKEVNFSNTRLKDLESQLETNRAQILRLNSEVEEIQIQLKETENKLGEGYIHLDEKKSELSHFEQKFFSARNKILEMEEKAKKMNRNQNTLQLEIQKAKEKLTDVKFKISSVSERLRIEFDIDINSIIGQEPNDNYLKTDLSIEVEKLKTRLHNFGEINPMAVETFNEMKERFDSITSQRQDILDAQDTLIKTINEIEATATQQFLESFEQIRLHFIDVFRSLFTSDDNCDLILLDTENPLESKIEIIAKPKGKRPKSLSQLSGGEKTLTATALLFALYLLKPAPFCIFDEVDAPLDDANIKKFNKIIKKFSKDSQFIIVTHNKSTMAEVDVLYGVYMQNMGISEVTPVDFRTLKHEDYIVNLN